MNEKIDPWSSKNINNYKHVFKEFGLKEFSDYNISNNYLFRRKIVIAHRDFEKIKQAIDKNKKFIQLTAIASSGNYHLGHKLNIELFLAIKQMGAKCLYGVADIDAYVSRDDKKISSMEQSKKIAVENVCDLLALGLKPEEIYVQSQKEKRYYQLTYEVSKKITENMFKAVYGHQDLGKVSAVILQLADILHLQLPEYEGKTPTIVGIGIDQDPHARLTRDVVKRLNYDMEVPSFIYYTMQSGLTEGTKMSSSEKESAIFLNDKKEDIKKKINKAFTGGKVSLDDQKKNGGTPEICKVYEVFKFHNKEDDFLEKTYKRCKQGNLLCGECKQNCILFLTNLLENHQKKAQENKDLAKKIVYG